MPNAGYRPQGPHVQINKVVSHDAVQTTLQVVPVPDEGVYRLEVEVMGLRTDGIFPANRPSACYTRHARIANTGGHVTVYRPEADLTSQDDLSWRVFLDPWSANVRVSVQGGAGATVSWTAVSRLFVQL